MHLRIHVEVVAVLADPLQLRQYPAVVPPPALQVLKVALPVAPPQAPELVPVSPLPPPPLPPRLAGTWQWAVALRGGGSGHREPQVKGRPEGPPEVSIGGGGGGGDGALEVGEEEKCQEGGGRRMVVEPADSSLGHRRWPEQQGELKDEKKREDECNNYHDIALY